MAIQLRIYKEQKADEYISEYGKDKLKENLIELTKQWTREFDEHNIFDDYFDSILNEENLKRLDEIRSKYHNTRWNKKDFK